MSYLIVHFDDKSSKATKMKALTSYSREKSVVRKVKKTRKVSGKPIRRGEKPRVSKGECPLLLQALYYVKNGSFPCTMTIFFLKDRPFLYLTSL